MARHFLRMAALMVAGRPTPARCIGGSQTWTNSLFNFGPVNTNNIISSTNQTILQPTGNYTLLRMLASGLQGNRPSQMFVVTYTDNSSVTNTQSLSDWFTPQNYAGESKAVV